MANSLKLLAARFTKIVASRNIDFDGKMSMKTNLQITSIEKTKSDNDSVKVEYSFEVDYSELGSVALEGYIFLGAESETIVELIDSWESKKVDTPEYAAITNMVIKKASVKALEIEEELALPIHLKLPTVKLNQD